MPTIPSRRQFLKSAALALPAFSALRLQAEGPAPSEKVTLGCIGLGIHGGSYNLRNFLEIPEARVVAVCDVYADRCITARDKVNEAYGNQDCAIHADFRELLARTEVGGGGVLAATPGEANRVLDDPDYSLVRALQTAQQNFVITDPTLPDNPIVFASQGFLDLTGYSLEQVSTRIPRSIHHRTYSIYLHCI